MNPILAALQNLGIIKNPQIVSPLPQSDSPGGYNDSATDPGLNYYYQQQAQADSIPAQFSQKALGQVISRLTGGNVPQAYAQEAPQNATTYEKQAANIFNKYDVPPAVGLGIWAMEGRGKTINPNNPYNIGAYDTNPQNAKAYKFSNPLEGTDAAAQFLAGKSPYQTPQVQKIFQKALSEYKKTGDQNAYLQAIASTYSTNPNYFNTIINTPEYQRWSYNK